MHERHGLGGGEIDSDLIRRQIEADDDDIRIGQQKAEALDEEDRQGDLEPAGEIDLAIATVVAVHQAAIDQEELSECRQIGCGERCLHSGDSGCGRTAADGQKHDGQDQGRTDDIGGAQAEQCPAIGARCAVKHVAKRDHRQGEDGEKEGDEVIVLDSVAEEMQGRDAGQCQDARARHGKEACRGGQAADLGIGLVLVVLRQEANDGGVESEAGEIAGENDQNPDEDENAVFELAHQAGLNDLRHEGDGGTDDADGKGDRGHALGAGRIVFSTQRAHETRARGQPFFRCFQNSHRYGRNTSRWVGIE